MQSNRLHFLFKNFNFLDNTDDFFGDNFIIEVSFAFGAEFDCAGNQRKNSVILAHTDAFAGQNICAALANNHRTSLRFVAFGDFNTKVFWIGISPVFGGAC